MNSLILYARELVGKIWEVGKLITPFYALWILIEALFNMLFVNLKGWFLGVVAEFQGKVAAQLDVMGVDLTPPPAFLAFVAKVNFVVPLEEMWNYFLLYLAFASVVVGVKWARNLIPGLK